MLIFVVGLSVTIANQSHSKLKYIYTMKHYTVIKRMYYWYHNTWMDLSYIFLDASHQSQKTIYFMSTLIQHSGKHKTIGMESVATRGWECRRGWLQRSRRELGIGDYWTLLYLDCDICYMAICVCQNSQSCLLKVWVLLYVNYTLLQKWNVSGRNFFGVIYAFTVHVL